MPSAIKSIVIADDDRDDIEIFKEAIAEVCPDVSVTIATDGGVLVDLLTEIPKPGAILLDLNMPGKSGKECLYEIRKKDEFADVPIIILSTSSSDHDIAYCLNNGADDYFVKPPSYIAMKRMVETICNGRFNKRL